LISDAYRSLLVTRPGQSTSDDAVDEAFRALNDLVDSWQIERLMVYNIERTVYPLAARVASYTLGPGGTLGSTRPTRTDGAGILRAGVESPLPVLSLQQYRRLTAGVYIDGAYPAVNVSVYPPPQAGEELALYSWAPISGFASLDASYQFPEGYVRALKWNLAMELAAGASIQKKLPEVLYEHIARNAVDSKAAIKSFHSSPPPTLDASDGGALGCGCGGGYNVYTDG
jgi:hypothetical protein